MAIYEWNTTATFIFEKIAKSIQPKEESNKFKIWCYDNIISSKIVDSDAINSLLKELNKPEKNYWAECFLEECFIKKPEETFKVGDVIEVTTTNKDVFNCMIINTEERRITLIGITGIAWDLPIPVGSPFAIKRSELIQYLGNQAKSFKKIGFGSEYLN